jgi:hypothetical protein
LVFGVHDLITNGPVAHPVPGPLPGVGETLQVALRERHHRWRGHLLQERGVRGVQGDPQMGGVERLHTDVGPLADRPRLIRNGVLDPEIGEVGARSVQRVLRARRRAEEAPIGPLEVLRGHRCSVRPLDPAADVEEVHGGVLRHGPPVRRRRDDAGARGVRRDQTFEEVLPGENLTVGYALRVDFVERDVLIGDGRLAAVGR